MPTAARTNKVFDLPGGMSVFNYLYCDGPAAGNSFPDYAPTSSQTGNCSGCPGGGHCITTAFTTLQLQIPPELGLSISGAMTTPAPEHEGWPPRPFINPTFGRIIDDYRVKFLLFDMQNNFVREGFAHIPLFENYPAIGSTDRIKVFGFGMEVQNPKPLPPLTIYARQDSAHRAIGILGQVLAHIWLH